MEGSLDFIFGGKHIWGFSADHLVWHRANPKGQRYSLSLEKLVYQGKDAGTSMPVSLSLPLPCSPSLSLSSPSLSVSLSPPSVSPFCLCLCLSHPHTHTQTYNH